MIIRQSINFAAHLLAGVVLGALIVGSIQARRAMGRDEPLEPRYPPPEPHYPPPPEARSTVEG